MEVTEAVDADVDGVLGKAHLHVALGRPGSVEDGEEGVVAFE
ncbi:hypothetical protein ACFQH3_11060 [Haladaptatus sp. GCM10025707]